MSATQIVVAWNSSIGAQRRYYGKINRARHRSVTISNEEARVISSGEEHVL
jgi:hypothetical protein